MPQKRFKTKILFSTNNNNNHEGCAARFNIFEQATLGEFREHLASIDEEAEFFSLTGIAPETAAAAVKDGNNCGVGKERKGDGGKQKKNNNKKRTRKS